MCRVQICLRAQQTEAAVVEQEVGRNAVQQTQILSQVQTRIHYSCYNYYNNNDNDRVVSARCRHRRRLVSINTESKHTPGVGNRVKTRAVMCDDLFDFQSSCAQREQ